MDGVFEGARHRHHLYLVVQNKNDPSGPMLIPNGMDGNP